MKLPWIIKWECSHGCKVYIEDEPKKVMNFITLHYIDAHPKDLPGLVYEMEKTFILGEMF